MVRIAITGGIACGKSLVGSFFADEGVPVCEADELGHQLMLPGSAAFGEVVDEFGVSILDGAGEISRKLLGEVVFSDPSRLERLNAIMHPAIERAWEDWLSRRSAAGEKAAAVVIPLLYETGSEKGWDCIVCVSAYESLQLVRLMGRGLSEDAARSRMQAQGPITGKMALADYVIVNNGAIDTARAQAMRIMGNILKR